MSSASVRGGFSHRQLDPLAVAEEERRLIRLAEDVRDRRLGFPKAAELAGVPQARFLEVMAARQVTPFDYDEDELEGELS